MKIFKKHCEKEIIYYPGDKDNKLDLVLLQYTTHTYFFLVLNNIKIFECDSLKVH